MGAPLSDQLFQLGEKKRVTSAADCRFRSYSIGDAGVTFCDLGSKHVWRVNVSDASTDRPTGELLLQTVPASGERQVSGVSPAAPETPKNSSWITNTTFFCACCGARRPAMDIGGGTAGLRDGLDPAARRARALRPQ